jgi:His-Xaa-Ser system protein (TIGR03982 family)
LRVIFQGVVAAFCVGWLFKELLLPAFAALRYNNAYIELVEKCDTAMEAAWYGESEDPIEKAARDVHLLDCHEYDKTRKKMLFMGLPESYLSWLGLRSLEIHQRPASDLAEQHMFIER